ncbi:MAG: hypothetical protein KF850_39605 [Labilithrix sp.]|nr:hypothetical protein [Labilithrix sp.]MBX3218180.1 hypothetical protein [Labilithrix sp.]
MKRKRWSIGVVLVTAAAGAVGAACASSADVGAPVRRERGATASLPDASVELEVDVCELEPGSSCLTATERVCERGAHAAPYCNEVMRCVGSSWERTRAAACAATCPAAHDPRAPGACDVANAGTLLCAYPEGTCGCAPAHVEDEDEADDGGVSPTRYVWTCVKPAPGCPRTRPRLGARCVTPMECDYGVCVFEHGALVRCASGRWDVERVPCRF